MLTKSNFLNLDIQLYQKVTTSIKYIVYLNLLLLLSAFGLIIANTLNIASFILTFSLAFISSLVLIILPTYFLFQAKYLNTKYIILKYTGYIIVTLFIFLIAISLVNITYFIIFESVAILFSISLEKKRIRRETDLLLQLNLVNKNK